MPTVEEKLELFDTIIYNDAIRARDAIRDQLRHDSEQILESQKADIKREAALEYQRETLRAATDRDSRISKARINTRVRLMSTRNAIVANVLDELAQELADFTKTEAYRGYLVRSVSDAVQAVVAETGGSGALVIYLTPDDLAAYADEARKLAPGADIRPGDADMIGGAKVESIGQGVYVDNSIKKKVEGRAEELLKISGLTIEK